MALNHQEIRQWLERESYLIIHRTVQNDSRIFMIGSARISRLSNQWMKRHPIDTGGKSLVNEHQPYWKQISCTLTSSNEFVCFIWCYHYLKVCDGVVPSQFDNSFLGSSEQKITSLSASSSLLWYWSLFFRFNYEITDQKSHLFFHRRFCVCLSACLSCFNRSLLAGAGLLNMDRILRKKLRRLWKNTMKTRSLFHRTFPGRWHHRII